MATRSVNLTQHRHFVSENLHRFANMKLLVIGDLGLDEYVSGEVKRISPEAPVPVVDVAREAFRLGLSGNVAQNVASLGGVPILVSAVGEDTAADQLRTLLREAGVTTDGLVVDRNRPTTRKLRVMAEAHHIVRVDYETRGVVKGELENAIVQRISALIPSCAGVILQDYGKGVLSPRIISHAIGLAHEQKKQVLLDPERTSSVERYRGVDLIKPNFAEALALTRENESEDPGRTDELVIRMGRKLMETLQAKQVVMTLGKKGMQLFTGDESVHLPTCARQIFDVTGAGDTVIATLALAWLSGFSLEQACVTANYAAGVVVGKVGSVPCTLAELRESLSDAIG